MVKGVFRSTMLGTSCIAPKMVKIHSEQLPPSENVLVQHAKRACYQAKIWRSSLEGDTSIPSPYDNYEWIMNDTVLRDNWFTFMTAPQQCLELLSCSCKKQCFIESCCCLDNNAPCTDIFSIECQNTFTAVINNDDDNK